MAAIREWRNSFIDINRIPLDILSLIPTHLSSQRERLRASFVCRHWRRTFLQRAELWSELILSSGEVYVNTFLERAKGSALDIIVDRGVAVSTMALLSSHTKRFRSLEFECDDWTDVQRFSEVNSGPLPLLRVLAIKKRDGLQPTSSPPSPLFSNAVNLRVFRFHSRWSQSFTCFVFPNLVSFDFSARPSEGPFVSRLLDFLEASPTLQTVSMRIIADVSCEGVPRERVVILPNVENFNLTVSDGGPGYKLATHLSCPRAAFTSLTHRTDTDNEVPEEIFPASISWHAIIRQYSRSPVEEITLEIKVALFVTCKLTFRSADAAIIELCFRVVDEHDFGFYLPSEEMQNELLTQSIRAIRTHPQLAHVKRLHICHSFRSFCSIKTPYIANEVGQLLKSMGPLDELTIYNCDIRPYFDPFPIFPEDFVKEPVVFPPIKELTILHPAYTSDEQCKAAMVGLSMAQHKLGIPFERVVICRESFPPGMEEELKKWVGSVECCRERRELDDD